MNLPNLSTERKKKDIDKKKSGKGFLCLRFCFSLQGLKIKKKWKTKLRCFVEKKKRQETVERWREGEKFDVKLLSLRNALAKSIREHVDCQNDPDEGWKRWWLLTLLKHLGGDAPVDRADKKKKSTGFSANLSLLFSEPWVKFCCCFYLLVFVASALPRWPIMYIQIKKESGAKQQGCNSE